MAAVNAVNVALLAQDPVQYPDASAVRGKLRVWHDTYEASSLAAGSTITVAKLPGNVRVMDVKLMTDALGTGVTLTVGDATSAARFVSSKTATSAVDASLDVIDGLGYQYTDPTDIIVTTGAASATGTIKTVVIFTEA